MKTKQTIKQGILYIFPIFWALVTLFPFYVAIISSVKTNNEIFGSMFQLPKEFHFEYYMDAVVKANMLTCIKNSLIITFGTVILLVIVSSMISFAITRSSSKWMQLVYFLFILGIMLPIHSTLIPLARIMSKLNGINNFIIIILIYVAFQLPLSVFLITGFMKNISKELAEAAVIDGCNLLQLLFSIFIPISKPIISTSAILAFLAVYNELIFSVMFITDRKKFTISKGLLYFVGEKSVQMGPVFASIIIAITPMLIIYLLFHNNVQRGMLAGSVKG